MNGRSQAIRLPKEFRVAGDSVTVTRVPEGFLVTEGDAWDICEKACAEMSENFFSALDDRNNGLKLEKRDFRD